MTVLVSVVEELELSVLEEVIVLVSVVEELVLSVEVLVIVLEGLELSVFEVLEMLEVDDEDVCTESWLDEEREVLGERVTLLRLEVCGKKLDAELLLDIESGKTRLLRLGVVEEPRLIETSLDSGLDAPEYGREPLPATLMNALALLVGVGLSCKMLGFGTVSVTVIELGPQ